MLCQILIWLSKSFDKMIKPTKPKNALTGSDPGVEEGEGQG